MAKNKTEDIKDLVEDILADRSEPWPNDITFQVILAIENNPKLMARYKELKANHHPDVIHCWIGKYTRQYTGLKSDRPVRVKGHLITGYRRLVY